MPSVDASIDVFLCRESVTAEYFLQEVELLWLSYADPVLVPHLLTDTRRWYYYAY